ncbi:MAG: guanylate kinase [Bacteroidia bacterium]|nr:guanylate kinase [Bacteroidia bacterium]MDW8333052.1 guanylate kinase [Bacteroidia bacterium]
MNKAKAVILTAPSGSGKTTIGRELMRRFPALRFSVSATTRPPRPGEIHGRDYYFLTPEEFDRHIVSGSFVEWEEVYSGMRYGTLRSEIERIVAEGGVPLFDVDVQGAKRLCEYFDALAIFILPPSKQELENRLRSRAHDSPSDLARRLEKADRELQEQHRFSLRVVNDDLTRALDEISPVVARFIA